MISSNRKLVEKAKIGQGGGKAFEFLLLVHVVGKDKQLVVITSIIVVVVLLLLVVRRSPIGSSRRRRRRHAGSCKQCENVRYEVGV